MSPSFPSSSAFQARNRSRDDVVIGLTVGGTARAYPWESFATESPIVDRVNGMPLLLLLGPDRKSFRVFVSRIDGHDTEFFLQSNADVQAGQKDWNLLDTTTASQWNFQGCATSGPAQGKCLDRVPALKDYWFDWRNYHPDTSVYKH